MIKKPVFSPAVSEKNSLSFLRFLFAFSIFISHFAILTDNPVYWWPIPVRIRVSGFFIISGFLIMRSFYRSKSLGDYISRRVRRIIPPYFLIVITCAVLFSCISALSFQDYFSSKEFFRYLAANLSTLNFIQPTLPGVFTTNLFPFVNGSLWTMKIEIAFYIFVPFLALLIKRRPIYLLVGLYILSFLFDRYTTHLYDETGNELYLLFRRQMFGQMRFFISGIILLFYFDFVKAHVKWLLPFSCMVFFLQYFVQHWAIDFFFPLTFAIVIISFAYYFKKLAIVTKYGDFSYGFYLFHFPIIQLMIYLGYFDDNPVVLFSICFLFTLLLSILSWHLLEKRILKRTNRA